MNRFEKARQKYRPDKIKYLLIAETPPKLDSNRFFYFEDVTEQDSLFLETMKVLYPDQTLDFPTKTIRAQKAHFLQNFKRDGYYLIDALEQPFEESYSTSQKIKLVERGQKELLNKIQSLLEVDTKVILISAPVYRANYYFLRQNNVPVINEDLIDFPGSGGQKKYREKMQHLLGNQSG